MIKILKRLKAKEWLLIGISVLFIVLQVWLDLRIPEYMSDITLLVTSDGGEISEILKTGSYMLLCALGSLLTAITVGYFAARIASGLSMKLRSDIFEKVESFSMEEMSSFSTASLITRSTNDITQVQMIVAMGLQIIIKAPIMAAMAIGKVIDNGTPQWAALLAFSLLFLVSVIICIMLYAIPKFKKIQWLTDNLNRVTRENLTGLQVVRAYNAEDYQEQKFDSANTELTENNLKAQRMMTLMGPAMNIALNGISLGIYWIGAFLINSASITEKMTLFSNMVVFSSYAMQVVMAFTMLIMIFIMLPRASVSAKRINEVLETKPKISDGTVTDGKTELTGTVEFKNVSFKYPDADEYVLHDISFKADKGETVAFIGSTGSGKSTIVNLALRFYDVSEGEILVDGINVKEYTKEALCGKFGYVPQKAVLFSGTVSSNVAYGDSCNDNTDSHLVEKAVEIAQGKDFVENLENAYEGSVAQGGTNFSGGQKQRLSIARAIARKPEIYVFDDSFSALDYKTDRILRSALGKATSGITNLIVAQRIGTIKDADRIIVLDEGRIVGSGTHVQLLENCEIYREIALSQLSKEELGA